MSYLERTLSDGETVIHKAVFHWTYTLGAWIILITGAISSLVFWLILSRAAPDWEWTASAFFVLFAIQFLRLMIEKWTTEIAVTNRRFIYKRGWIARRSQELPVHRVEEVNVDQGVLGRILGFGKLRVHGTGGDRPISTPSIDDPLNLRKALLQSYESISPR